MLDSRYIAHVNTLSVGQLLGVGHAAAEFRGPRDSSPEGRVICMT